ncbi:MAG: InlB B-repeat-containing protein [Bacteroidales bacterium]|nr:InlB B-repeat-containing protein [Bacteroidales bacterium]
MFTACCGEKGANLGYVSNSNRDAVLQPRQNVKIMLSTDGGVTYTESVSYLGTIQASRYTMSSDNAVSSSNKTLSESESYATGVISSSITFTASATHTGYEFVGWGISDAGPTKKADTYNYLIGGEATIYAYYKKNTPVYTVMFHANWPGSDPASDPAAQQVEENMCAAKPKMAAVKWYELEGWYTDEACTVRWMFEEPVTRDMDLYAHWIGGNYPTMAVHASFLNWDVGGAQKMTKSEDGKSASYTHTFTEAVADKEFGLREYTNEGNQADWWAFKKSYAPTITESTTVQLYSEKKITKDSTTNIKITVSEPQEVTFTFDYVRKTLTVSYASDNQNKYRLVYVESAGGVTQVFHPSHTIAAADHARMDTVSLYVKPYARKAIGSNSNDCYVLLQQMTDGKVWAEKQRIDVKAQTNIFTTNGVYNFVLVQDGSGASLPVEKVLPYSGNYYIRLGLDRDYRSSEKVFRFSDYASKYDARFDHYFCKYVEGSDVRFCVACDYSACVSDTLAQEPDDDPHHDYTDANGKLLHNANVRFMWNSENNSIDRDYLAGSGSNVILLSQSGISTTQGGGAETNVVLTDAQNWVYQHDVYAAVGTRVKLRVKPYNDANEYLYLKGKDGDFSNENTVELIGGSTGKTLKVRMIYDFKSNHLICAWLPEQSYTIEGELSLNSDLILIRKEHNDAQQITFKGDNAQITKVSQAYGVLSLSRSHFGNKNVSDNAKKFYWISFPFDVHLSEVFSALTYGKDYVLKYYDGVERAEKGCWKDSPSFWKMYRSTEGVKLEKGKGYLLHVNISDTASFFAKGNTEVNIYFPSANTDSMTISGKIDSTAVPQHPCTIQRDHRNIYDSNWNLIGVPAWANVNDMDLPKATVIEGISVKFLYDYVPDKNGYNTVDATQYNFGSMKAYMVQFAGTIHWKEKSITPSQKPLRAPAAANEKTIRLDLLRGEERLDHTFVQLSDNEGITEGFDLNSDLTKVHNQGCNLYTLIGSEQIEAAANILPMSERTIYVPVGVSVDSDGTYTFALPEEMEGMDVRIADAETGYTHNLLFSPYEVSLTAGTHTQRFSLEIHASSQVTTGCSETDAAGERLRKVLLNGQLLLQTGERLYDAQGKRLW